MGNDKQLKTHTYTITDVAGSFDPFVVVVERSSIRSYKVYTTGHPHFLDDVAYTEIPWAIMWVMLRIRSANVYATSDLRIMKDGKSYRVRMHKADSANGPANMVTISGPRGTHTLGPSTNNDALLEAAIYQISLAHRDVCTHGERSSRVPA